MATPIPGGAEIKGAKKLIEGGVDLAKGLVRVVKPAAKATEGLVRAKPLAAAVEHPDELVQPGVVGEEKDPAERVDNAMFRLGGSDTAGKVEALKAIKALPKAVKDPKVQEELTHALEERLKPAPKVQAVLKIRASGGHFMVLAVQWETCARATISQIISMVVMTPCIRQTPLK